MSSSGDVRQTWRRVLRKSELEQMYIVYMRENELSVVWRISGKTGRIINDEGDEKDVPSWARIALRFGILIISQARNKNLLCV